MRKHFYDDESFNYQNYWRNRRYEDLSEQDVLNNFFDELKAKIPLAQAQILEVGAGFGRLAPLYLPLINKAVLLEPSLRLRRIIKKRLREFSNYCLQGETIEKANFKSNQFDLVLMVRVFHHLTSPETAIRRISRVIKKRGFFILEFPNKLHFRNLFRFTLSGKRREIFSERREDRRSQENIRRNSIPFFNYHPHWVTTLLEKNGFSILRLTSVSNWRSPILKRILPLGILIFLERTTRPLFSCLNFGPSIFLLCQKK